VAGSLLAACGLALFAAEPSLAPLLLGLPATATSPLAGHVVHALVLLPLVYAAARGLEAAEGDRGVLRWLVAGFASVGLFALTVFLRSGLAHAAVGGFVAFMAACSALVLASALRLPPRSRARWLGFALLALTLLDVSTAAFWSVRPVLHGSSAVADAIGPTP
jgi:hypothetical protein